MKLALYLPNFRTEVTVTDLEVLTDKAEALDFDSVWTLDRIVVPDASDRGELQYPFGMMEQFPTALPVAARGTFLQGMPLIPWLAARTEKVRIGMSIIDTPYRAPAVLAAELATIDQLSHGRLNVGIGSGWMPEEFAAASASHIFKRRHTHVRETIEIMQGIWTNELFEYHGEFADFDLCGFGAKPVQDPLPIYFSGLKDPKRSAKRIAKYGLNGWIGIQDTPEEIARWRAEMTRELAELGSDRTLEDGFDMCSMIWFTVTDEPTDQTPNGKLSNLMVGTAEQITENLIAYKRAGLTMPLLWPPFADVPVSKTLEDLEQLSTEIMPAVEAA